eukprot:662027-Pelagomonas_calceolata.AAC.8
MFGSMHHRASLQMIRVFDDQMSVSAASSWPEERLQVCGKRMMKSSIAHKRAYPGYAWHCCRSCGEEAIMVKAVRMKLSATMKLNKQGGMLMKVSWASLCLNIVSS